MPMAPLDRKVALIRLRVSHQEIAAACGVDRSLISHVVAARRTTGEDARRVMQWIADRLGLPLAVVFPETLAAGGPDGGPEAGVESAGEAAAEPLRAVG